MLLILACSATAHFVMACVLAVYARYKVQYLALTWIMGIFAVSLGVCAPFAELLNGTPGIMHPLMLLTLTATSFLQSIYTLCIPMPAYLQWGRMWKYALPIIVLICIYGTAVLCGMHPLHLDSWNDVAAHWYSPDLWMRIAALGISVYYIVNILRLPSKEAHNAALPRYLKGYCTVLGASAIFYLYISLWYNAHLVLIYQTVFTLLNLYLCFRTLETMAISLPKPTIEKVEQAPTPEAVETAEKEDFNEANLQRFKRVEYWMQNNREEWTKSTFNRDQLCEQVGLNRHLLLQCVRSQGYNDTHEYLNTYRFEELKRLIQRGDVRTISETVDAGFGTTKTARSVFMKLSGQSLDDFLAAHKA